MFTILQNHWGPVLVIVIAAMIALDFAVFRFWSLKNKRRRALLASLMWLVVSLLIAGFLSIQVGGEQGVDFTAAFLASKSVSVGEAFILYLVLWALGIPGMLTQRLLFAAMIASIVLRTVFLAAGYSFIPSASWIAPVLGVITVLMALQFLLKSDRTTDVTEHWAVLWIARIIPFSKRLPPGKYFVVEDGRRKGTPLLLASLVIGVSVGVFALTAFPASYAVTADPLTGFTGGLLGLVGLRSLYFVIAGWGHVLRAMKPGLTLGLGYLGVAAAASPWIRIESAVTLILLAVLWVTSWVSAWYLSRNRPALTPTR